MRLIDADALGIGKANRNCFDDPKYADGWNSAIEIINNAPTIEVKDFIEYHLNELSRTIHYSVTEDEPVRHGEWRIFRDGCVLLAECPECGTVQSGIAAAQWDYCPMCGAKMDGAADDADALLDRR